jgi:hypothetical protein
LTPRRPGRRTRQQRAWFRQAPSRSLRPSGRCRVSDRPGRRINIKTARRRQSETSSQTRPRRSPARCHSPEHPSSAANHPCCRFLLGLSAPSPWQPWCRRAPRSHLPTRSNTRRRIVSRQALSVVGPVRRYPGPRPHLGADGGRLARHVGGNGRTMRVRSSRGSESPLGSVPGTSGCPATVPTRGPRTPDVTEGPPHRGTGLPSVPDRFLPPAPKCRMTRREFPTRQPIHRH